MSGALAIAGAAFFGGLVERAIPGLIESTGTQNVLIHFPRVISGASGMVVPDCIVEETGRDDMQITEHPIEFGSTISDHAFKKPREVTLRWNWSNSPPAGFGNYMGHGSEQFVQQVYLTLLKIQNSPANLLTIYTGKSQYSNMLIASIGQTTNEGAEYSLTTVMVCREVIIVSTSGSVAPQSAQAIPASTSPTLNQGQTSLQSQPISAGQAIMNATAVNPRLGEGAGV